MIRVCTFCSHEKFEEIDDSFTLDIEYLAATYKYMDRNNEIGTTEHRPWGNFTILDVGDGYKVKRIEVLPGKRLSYQKHARRSEHWFAVAGAGKVTLDDVESVFQSGTSVDIAVGTKHRIENPHDEMSFVFIETQTGDYFGEDDIVRFEDDFGRAA